MTNPQGPPGDPTAWGRPGHQGPFNQPTERIRGGQLHGGRPQDATQPGQLPGPTEQFGAPRANAQQPGWAPPPVPPGSSRDRLATPKEEPAAPPKKKRGLRNPLSIFLVVIIVIAVIVGGLIGAELIVRGKATSKIAEVAACKTQDSATAKFGVAPLVLWQLATDHYTNITVETAGNHLRDAQGMKLLLKINNIQLKDSADSKGTIGSIDATITWTATGIQQTLKTAVHGLGGYLFSSVTTQPNDQTIALKGPLDNMVVKPEISNGGLKLEIVSFNVVGINLNKHKEDAQKYLDEYTSKLTDKLPLGIQADKVEVNGSDVVAHFAVQNATIPNNNTQDECFKNL